MEEYYGLVILFGVFLVIMVFSRATRTPESTQRFREFLAEFFGEKADDIPRTKDDESGPRARQ